MPAAAAIKRKLRQVSKSVSCLEVSRVVPKPRAQADKHGGLSMLGTAAGTKM